MRNKLMAAGLLFAGFLAASFAANATLPIQQWRTAGGARVLFVETHDLPIIDVAVDFPAGSSRDSLAKSGVAAMTVRVMRMGTEGLDEDDISTRLANVGAEMSARFDTDRAGFSLRTLSNPYERDQSLAVLESVLRKPSFPQAIIDRERQRVLAGLRESDTKPEILADREFKRLTYGDHPYAMRGSGEIDSVAALTRDDLVDFYQRHFVPARAVVSIIGDLTQAEARAIAERIAAANGRSQSALRRLPPVSPLPSMRESRISHPSSQAHILVGQPGIRRLDPDYFALWLGNYVLGGGGFSSRLNEEIRQKRGFAYSAYSYFSPLDLEGPFLIGLQTRKDQAEEALKVARDTLQKFVTEGPTQQELDAAKQNIVGGFPLRIDSNRKIHEYLSLIGFYDLPLTYLDDFPAMIERVTLVEVKDAFRRRIHPDRMAVVIVGGAESR